jgi:hypothetical protein
MTAEKKTDHKQRIHRIREVIFTLTKGIDELAKGYRFDDRYGEHKIKQLVSARDGAVSELNVILSDLEKS